MVDRKNFSFYMATDFTDKLEQIKANDPGLKTLSRSQALYFIISDMAKRLDPDSETDDESDESTQSEPEDVVETTEEFDQS